MERYIIAIHSNRESNQFNFSREDRQNKITKSSKEKQPRHKNDVWKLNEGNAMV